MATGEGDSREDAGFRAVCLNTGSVAKRVHRRIPGLPQSPRGPRPFRTTCLEQGGQASTIPAPRWAGKPQSKQRAEARWDPLPGAPPSGPRRFLSAHRSRRAPRPLHIWPMGAQATRCVAAPGSEAAAKGLCRGWTGKGGAGAGSLRGR